MKSFERVLAAEGSVDTRDLSVQYIHSTGSWPYPVLHGAAKRLEKAGKVKLYEMPMRSIAVRAAV